MNFPDNNYFRFENCDGYKKLSHIKEMDACWYDQENDILYIIELKNWENNNLIEESNSEVTMEKIKEMKESISKHRVNELIKKSLDSLCMLNSILLNKPFSENIQKCIAFSFTIDTKIKLLSIINWTETDNTYISNINTQYRTKFNSYAKLFDIKTFLVLTKSKASEVFPWVS